VLAKFALRIDKTGVRKDNKQLAVLEAYPSSCRDSVFVKEIALKIAQINSESDQDIQDALTCAIIAYLFDKNPHVLETPNPDFPEKEGWIWTIKN